MKADFTRDTFDARKHYGAVLQQQGRVQVDADWNEQQRIQAHRAATLSSDVIGATGAPNTNAGFGLWLTDDGTDLVIAPGRYYVDGLPCENEGGAVFAFTSVGDAVATLALPRPDLAAFAAGQWISIGVDAGTQQTLRIVAVAVTDSTVALTLSAPITRPAAVPTGVFGGALQAICTYLTQPDWPAPDQAVAATNDAPAHIALPVGPAIAYLDVWERCVGALDDPDIRETALGGPDTAVRVKTVWQLRLLPVAPVGQASTCATDFPEWDALQAGSSGAMSARAAPAQGQAGPCLIPPGGGYQGLENQLYRVEIHAAGADGVATFKWSRDNGSVVTGVRSFDGSTLTVASTGPDDALGLANGQWVEILGDVEELHGLPGQLLQIATVDPSTSRVTFAAPPTAIDAGLNPKMRRWDGAAGATTVPAGGGAWLDLESGVQVVFTAGTYATGDYWLVPARAGAAASVEWQDAAPVAPRGVRHHYARVGLVNWTGVATSTDIGDCRASFASLTDIPPALHVTGISWQNDDVVSLAQFSSGLAITLDGAPITQYTVDIEDGGAEVPTALSLMTANDSSVVVTLEMPIPVPNQPAGAASPPTMPVPVVLAGSPISWSTATSSLVWMPSVAATTIVNSITGGQARVRVRLKGDFIWGDQSQQRLYLDGEVRGQPGLSASRPNTLRTDLALPSGTGRRSSDFESWFTLQFADTPVSLRDFFLSQSIVVGSGSVTAQVDLASIARAAVAVTLAASSAPQIAVGAGTSMAVPIGQATATSTIAFAAPASSSLVTLTASVPAVPGSNLSTTLSASVMVVVVAVAVSPPVASLLVNATLRFSATVSGVGLALPAGIDETVRWSCTGGAIDATGVYSAPATSGTYTVIATSVADPTRTAQASVTVRTKTKDKDKDKEREKQVLEQVIGTKQTDKAIEGPVRQLQPPLPVQMTARDASAATPPTASAFITSEERPQVGAAARADEPAAQASEKATSTKAHAHPAAAPAHAHGASAPARPKAKPARSGQRPAASKKAR